MRRPRFVYELKFNAEWGFPSSLIFVSTLQYLRLLYPFDEFHNILSYLLNSFVAPYRSHPLNLENEHPPESDLYPIRDWILSALPSLFLIIVFIAF